MSELVHIFSPWFYQTDIILNEKYKNKVKEKLKSLYYRKKYLNINNWNCNVHSSYGEKRLPDGFNWGPLLDAYSMEIDIFIKKMNISGIYFNIPDIWYNVYGGMQNQEMHSHLGSGVNFSAIHYIKFDPELHHPVRFCNTNDSFKKKRSNEEINELSSTGIGYYQDTYSPDVKEDSFLIFPTCLSHEVPIQKSKELRMSIAMNIQVKIRENTCC